jgi:hypothetical protein
MNLVRILLILLAVVVVKATGGLAALGVLLAGKAVGGTAAYAALGLIAPKASQMAKPKALLLALADPASANQPEAVPWLLYSRKTYTDNATTSLTFFDDQPARGFGNVNGGSLPVPQFFEVLSFGADLLRDPTAAAAAQVGAISDVQRLWYTSAATWNFVMSDKIWGSFPTSVLHPSGGVQGFGFGTTTADTGAIQYANNGMPDAGFPMNGAIIIKPKTAFTVNIVWPTAIDLTANIDIRFWMWGILHRRVL